MNKHDAHDESQPDAPDPLLAFHEGLTSLQIESGQLVDAIRRRACEDVERAAAKAVASYLIAKTALQRLDLRFVQSAEDLCAGSLALIEARHALEQLFERAVKQIAADSLHWLVRQLRLHLAIANGEPMTERFDSELH